MQPRHLFGFCIALFGPAAHAEAIPLETIRVGFSAAGLMAHSYDIEDYSDDLDSTQFTLGGMASGVTVGVPINAASEVGGNILYSTHSGFDETSENSLSRILVYYNHNFPVNTTTALFAEGLLGYGSTEVGELESGGAMLGVGGGAKFFVFDNVSIDTTLNLSTGFWEIETPLGEVDAQLTEALLRVGISLWFPRNRKQG